MLSGLYTYVANPLEIKGKLVAGEGLEPPTHGL